MVIIDDKPQNFQPAAPPPYIRSSSASSSQPGSSSSTPRPTAGRPQAPGLRIANPDNPNDAFDEAFGTRGNTSSNIASSSKRPRRQGNEDPMEAVLRRTAEDVPISPSREIAPPPFPRVIERKTLLDLPQHILLYVVQLSCLPRGKTIPETNAPPVSSSRPPAYTNRGAYDRGPKYGYGEKVNYQGYGSDYHEDYYRADENDPSEEEEWAEHAAGLYHLAVSVRLVSRGLYVACMHILRSTYLPLYSRNIKPPYTSDPFPASTPQYTPTPYTYPETPTTPRTATTYAPSNSSPLLTTHRETAVLDKFILLTLVQNLLTSESTLHTSAHPTGSTGLQFSVNNPDSLTNYTYYDLFSLHQPTARLEDLLLHYGLQNGSITLAPSSSRMVAFDYISVKLSDGARRVGLVIADTKGRKRVVTEYVRENRGEKLEIAAKKLAKELLAILKRSRQG